MIVCVLHVAFYLPDSMLIVAGKTKL